MDSDLNVNNHMKTRTKSAYYHLKNRSQIIAVLSQQDLEKRVGAFLFSRLDYCIAVFTELTQKSIRQLQLTRNAAARVLANF